MTRISQIVTGSRPAPAVTSAAKDLQHYLKQLFRQAVPIYVRQRKRPGTAISFDAPGLAKELGLSDQGYALQTAAVDRREVLQIAGGSAAAMAWAAYELAESWGVRYLTHRDMLPDKPGPLHLPTKPIVREPDMKIRGFRTYNDLWTPCHWPAGDFEVLLTQLMKLRYNAIIFMQYPDDACFDFKWQGAAKDVAAPNYGFEVPIRADAIGHELFEKSGDAQRGKFANPDICFEKDYDSTVKAGRRLFRRVCKMARQRGIAVSATVMSDFPWPIKQRLVEVTDKKFIKRRSGSTQGKTTGHFLEPPTMIIRYGDSVAGATKDMAAAMSIRNPMYLDLMGKAVQNYVDEFEGSDYLLLTTAEFRPSSADMGYAWAQLDPKYQISKIASLKKILRESRQLAEVEPKRSEYELAADISMLWLYDYLINVKPARRTARSPQVVPGRLSVELNQFLPRMFPHVAYYSTWAGYLPEQSIKRADTYTAFAESDFNATMWVNVEDDNVGIVPQCTGKYMYQTMPILRRHKFAGFFTRQFLQSKHVPTLNYVGHAAWDRKLTVNESHRHLFEGICGKAAMKPLMAAIGVLTKNTQEMYANLDCVSFIMPRIVSHMAPVVDVSGSPPGGTDEKVIERYRRIGQLYGRASKLLAEAQRKSRPGGREYLHAVQRHAQFGEHYMQALVARGNVTNARVRFIEAKKARQIEAAVEHQTAVMDYLTQTRDHYRRATQAWADCVEDRIDLGVLANLNYYICDTMDSIHQLASLENSWSILP